MLILIFFPPLLYFFSHLSNLSLPSFFLHIKPHHAGLGPSGEVGDLSVAILLYHTLQYETGED